MRTDPIELRSGDAHVVIDPDRGGRLVSWSVAGDELLVGPPSPDDRSIDWGCFLMAPWPGRLADGRFSWRGRTIQVPRTHGRHAIHGLGWDRAWRIVSAEGSRAALELDLAEAGWPPGGRVRETIDLAPDELTLGVEVVAEDPTPIALGWHPWFLRRGGARVRLDADAVLETDRMIPTGRRLPVTGRYDLRDGPPLGDRRIDDVFVGVRSPITVTWPDLELRIAFDPDQDAACVYTPREFFCIEPMTAPSNAFNQGGFGTLEAAERLASTTRLSWAAGPPAVGGQLQARRASNTPQGY